MTELEIRTGAAFAPLLQPARYKGAFGGRGSGKSHYFAEAAVEWCIQRPGTRGVCVREVQRSLKESVKLLIEDKIQAFGMEKSFRSMYDSIQTPGGGVILFQGMQDHTAESIKSLEGFDWAYVEEAQTLTARSLEFLRPTIRKPGSEIWFSWNPRHPTDPVDRFLRVEPPPNSAVVRVNYTENPFFPDVLEEEREFDERTNPLRYGHIWLGEYEPAAVGAIWDRENIASYRTERKRLPEMRRVLVAIDPAGSSVEGADETGIVVVGAGDDERGYVLDDGSLVGTPDQWARTAIALYDLHEADAIVAEVNFGGDMVVNTIHTLRPNIRVIKVRASRAKASRAEPISALYAQGKVSHVGTFSKLEAQMCLMTAGGYQGNGSPDRCLVAGTLVETRHGAIGIESIRPGDEVLTRKGFRRVLAAGVTGVSEVGRVGFSDGSELVGTGNHPVFAGCFQNMDALVWGQEVGHISQWKASGTTASSSSGIQAAPAAPREDISTSEGADGAMAGGPFIASFGKTITDLFLRVITSITRMATPATTISPISPSSLLGSMPPSMRPLMATSFASVAPSISMGCAISPPGGTEARRDWSGTANTERERGTALNTGQRSARSAETSIEPVRGSRARPAPAAVITGAASATGGSKLENASSAAASSRRDLAAAPGPAPVHVVAPYERQGTAKVYNLTVEGENEYYANGILVHNCDALVWGLSELFGGLTRRSIGTRPQANNSYSPLSWR